MSLHSPCLELRHLCENIGKTAMPTPFNSTIDAALLEAERRFIDRNPQSRKQVMEAAEVMPGGNTRSVLYHAPFPLVMARGEGCHLWDLDGHEYVDFLGEFTAGIFGHSHPIIRRAIAGALADGINLAAHTVREARLAGAVCERFPSIELVRFTNSGSEANLMAVALAKAFTRRSTIMVFQGAYHGGFLNFVSGESVLNVPHEYIVGSYNDVDGTAELIRERATDLAAVLAEPMLGSGGCIAATPEFLAMLREMTSKFGVMLIFDEVMTSRLAGGGMQALTGIHADLTTLGKYVGGGNSIGAFGGRADAMSLFDPRRPSALQHAGTFNNNVISMAAGLAGLTEVYTPAAADSLSRRGNELRLRLNEIFGRAHAPMQCTGLGSLMNFHATDRPISSPADLEGSCTPLRDLLFFHLLEEGIYTAKRGFIALSMPIGDAELDRLAHAVEDFWRRSSH
jgi:glutamate-1-semialdehyde 2,1-aminomutase